MNKLKSMIFCLVFLLLYIGAQIISSALIASVNLLFGTSSAILEQVVNRQIFVVQIVALVMFIVIVTFYQKGSKKIIWERETRDKRSNLWLPSLSLTLSFSIIWSMLTFNYPFTNMAMIQDGIKYFSEFSPFLGYFMMFISVMIAAPLGEELLFRRMMINRLSKAYSIWIAIFLSSLLFGAIHFIAGGLVLGLGAFMMGLILGFIYEFSGQNFILVVVAHSVANSADLILMGIKNNLFLPLSIILLMICLLSLRYIFIHAVKVTKN